MLAKPLYYIISGISKYKLDAIKAHSDGHSASQQRYTVQSQWQFPWPQNYQSLNSRLGRFLSLNSFGITAKDRSK